MRDLSLRMFEVDVEIHIFKAWVFFGNVFLKELWIFSGWSTRDGQQGVKPLDFIMVDSCEKNGPDHG